MSETTGEPSGSAPEAQSPPEWVTIESLEDEETVEVPCEPDGTLLLSTIRAQFPGASGIKFVNPETGGFRGVRCTLENVLLAPSEEGWGKTKYIIVRPKKVIDDCC